MKLRAFSLLETIVALSILAFVIAASMYHVGGLYARSQMDMGQVYLAVKELENKLPIQERITEHGAFQVESSISNYANGLDLLTVQASHKSGRSILTVKKLVLHVE